MLVSHVYSLDLRIGYGNGNNTILKFCKYTDPSCACNNFCKKEKLFL